MNIFRRKKEKPFTFFEKMKIFLATHWRGMVCIIWPLVVLPIPLQDAQQKAHWVSYCLLVMAVFWVTECIPLPVTSFLPIIIFPMTGLMSTTKTCACYINDSVLMFIGSLMLAYAVEQSGLHRRLAYCAIRAIGYSHVKLLLAMCIVTTFVSMWLTNTAAATMMVPIIFAILRQFENQGILKIYNTDSEGNKVATDITTCYFCAATFSATIGGIGTIVGTGTNIAFKGLFIETYPDAPDYLSFPNFSAFGVPLMVVLEICLFFWMAMYYFGFLRPTSDRAKSIIITDKAKAAAQKAIEEETKKMGSLSFWEFMVILLFGGGMIAFFCRSPQVFTGWGDRIVEIFEIEDERFVRDSALAFFVAFFMLFLPSTLQLFKNIRAKYVEHLVKGPAPSVLNWTLLNATLPFSFAFLLGAGFALAEASKASELNESFGAALKSVAENMPNVVVLLFVIIFVIFVTNFASNVAVANVFCPLAMQLAKEVDQNPLWYNVAAGFSASFCFMMPVGTPGNLIVQSAANIPTRKMIFAGIGPTLAAIAFTFVFTYLWAPFIWEDLNLVPMWAGGPNLSDISDADGDAKPPAI